MTMMHAINYVEETPDDGNDESEKFKTFLYDYIRVNDLQYQLCEKMMDVIHKFQRGNDFQMLVLDVVHHEVVPSLQTEKLRSFDNGRPQEVDAQKDFDQHFSVLLKQSTKFLSTNLAWAEGSLSIQQRFYWGILATSCSKIGISSNGSLRLLHQHSTVINKLTPVYSTYCLRKPVDQCIIISKLPYEIESHNFEGLRRYAHIILRCEFLLVVQNCCMQHLFHKFKFLQVF